jgi:hypothetical protein
MAFAYNQTTKTVVVGESHPQPQYQTTINIFKNNYYHDNKQIAIIN